MRLPYILCAAFAACALGGGAWAQETVKLEYKLPPGTELIYKSSGTIKMTMMGNVMQGTISDLARFVVADVDPATGVMLVGQLPATTLAMNTGSPGSAQTLDEVSACRMDRAGQPVIRQMKDEEKLPPRVRMMLRMLDQRQLDAVSLPAAAVALGATWESAMDLAIRGVPLRAPCKVVSTLAEFRSVDGHKCAVIESKLTPAGRQSAAAPDVSGSGEVETLFDVDGGFSRAVKSRLDLQVNQNGQAVALSAETTAVLDSTKSLPPEAFARERPAIRALDAAIAAAYDGDYDGAAGALQSLKPAELPAAWRAGISQASGTVRQFAQMAAAGAPTTLPAPPADPAQKLFAEAMLARQNQNWAEAADKFKTMADRFPDAAYAPDALIQAAHITETNLDDKKSADELRRRAVAIQEKRAAGDNAMEQYRLIETYLDAGDTEKAIQAYRKIIAAEGKSLPAAMRIQAQFRIGGLFEKTGKPDEAVAAYRAMAAIPADDEFSIRLKAQAKQRIQTLSAPPNP